MESGGAPEGAPNRKTWESSLFGGHNHAPQTGILLVCLFRLFIRLQGGGLPSCTPISHLLRFCAPGRAPPFPTVDSPPRLENANQKLLCNMAFLRSICLARTPSAPPPGVLHKNYIYVYQAIHAILQYLTNDLFVGVRGIRLFHREGIAGSSENARGVVRVVGRVITVHPAHSHDAPRSW